MQSNRIEINLERKIRFSLLKNILGVKVKKIVHKLTVPMKLPNLGVLSSKLQLCHFFVGYGTIN